MKLKNIFLCVLPILFLAVACTPTPTPTLPPFNTPKPILIPTATSTPDPVDLDPASLDGVEIEFWYVWEFLVDDVYQELIEDFNADNEYGITIQAFVYKDYGELFQAVDEAILAGQLPDIVLAYPYQYRAWHAAGLVVDMAPYLEDDIYGLSTEMQEDIYPVFWNKDVLGKQRLAFPAWHSGTVIFYNQTWASELGFSGPPSTPAAFKNQACAAAAANGDFTGGWMINTAPPVALGWFYAFGVEVESSAGGYALNTPQSSQALEFLYSLKNDLCAWKPGTPYPDEAFATRRGLFYSTSVLSIPSIHDAFDIAGNEDEWIPIPFPGFTGEPVIPVYGPSYVMLASSEAEQVASWVFTVYLSELENQANLATATGAFPANQSAVDLLVEGREMSDQWKTAAAFLAYGKMEPRYASWRLVRYTLQDIIFDIFRDSYDPDTLDILLDMLQSTAEELHLEAGGY